MRRWAFDGAARPRTPERAADDLADRSGQHERLGHVQADVGRRLRMREPADSVGRERAEGERRLVDEREVLGECMATRTALH